jgi:dTDP-4-amino-4,6-dideoxygalactose transaminase
MTVKVPLLDLQACHAPLRRQIDEAVGAVIDSCAFAGGEFVTRFEKAFATFCESPFAVGVGNGTDALWLALLALGVKPGDEVITVPNSFMATAEAITYCGARPVFVDVDERTYTMDPDALPGAITSKTKAIIPVHLFGQPADMDPILAIAQRHGIPVIEDAAQAHGARYKGRRAGTMGAAGCFSFYPGKNLGAIGEAGGIITNDPELAGQMRILRDHGQARKYHHAMVGWNCRMDGIQAAVLQVKLPHLERGNERRRAYAAFYNAAFRNEESIVRPFRASNVEHVYHVYAIRVQNREAFMEDLATEGIATGIHYPVPIHLQEAYAFLGHRQGSFPVAERCAKEFVSLPMFPELTTSQLEMVTGAVLAAADAKVLV